MAATLSEIQAELQKRGETTSNQSIFDPTGTSFEEFKKFAESSLKGPVKGIIDIIGGYGTLYDYLKQSKDPNAFSGTGISQAIKNLTGVNLQSVEGYKGAYEFGRAGAPAALLTAVGLPGLFSRTPLGIAGEYGVAGGTGVAAQTIAPDSPFAQLALQATPYAIKGGITQATKAITKPEGIFPPISETSELARVGRLTPGELGLNREQLATEVAIERTPSSGQKPIEFRQAQTSDVESFLTNLFNKASGKTLNIAETTQAVLSSFQNYGKSLTSKLRSDARTDFNAAKKAGGLIDTTSVVDAIKSKLGEIPPELKGQDSVKNAMQRIIDEYVIPEVPSQTIPSTILGPTGQPASINVIAGTPASNLKIDIDRLQKNLSTWGEAAYSGEANFGKGNIFEGVAVGQAKGIAIAVLNGFRKSLDVAIDNNVAGADKLKLARDKFKDNLAKIEQFSNRPLTQRFDVKDVTELTPEKVIRELKTMPPSERQFLIEVMQSHPSSQVVEVLNTIRREKFNDVLNAAQIKGGASTDPTFNIQTALTELDKKSGEFSTLFSSSKDAAEARLAMNWMRRTLAGESAGVGGVGLSGSEVYAATAAGGGGAPTRLALREIVPWLQRTIANPEDFANVIFNPDYRKAMIDLSTGKTTTKKVTNAIKTLSQGAAIMAARAGPMLQTESPEIASEVQLPMPFDDNLRLKEIQDALKALETQ
jgi:hypothetical protein